MKSLVLTLFFIGLVSSQPWVPQGRFDWWDWWWPLRHQNNIAEAEAMKHNTTTVFYGDSITEGWGENEYWMAEFAHLGSLNFAASGDQTQNNLYRILGGEVTPLTPKLVVLMIGGNNMLTSPEVPNEDIARGVDTIIDALLSFMPKTRILLLAMTPNSWVEWERLYHYNSLLAKMADDHTVYFLDMWDAFNATSPEFGVVDPEIFPDGAHMSLLGYKIWAEAMNSTFQYLWNLPPK